MGNDDRAAGKNLKRGLERDLIEDETERICQRVSLLNSALSDHAAVLQAICFLSNLATNKDLHYVMVRCGVVPALVRHLQVPNAMKDCEITDPYQHEVKKECVLVLGLLAFQQPQHQKYIIDAGGLRCLIDLLKMHKIGTISQPLCDLLRIVADAITNLADGNTITMTLVRTEGGIPLLVELLEFHDKRVQRAAARALRVLAYKNDDNKNKIVESNALPSLVLMLQSGDTRILYEAVGVIVVLLHSSPNLKKEVLLAGALQPIICLLSCSKGQAEAALLLGYFASTDSECKVQIAQRGAIPPLVEMLKSPDPQVQGVSAFALRKLAQDSHNKAGIAHSGGIEPLVHLLDSNNAQSLDNAVYALFFLADDEDVVVDIIKTGGFQRLKTGSFGVQLVGRCVAVTIKKLEMRTRGQVLKHLIYLMRFGEEEVQRRVAIALAYLCSPQDHKTVFMDNNGLKLLLNIFQSHNQKQKGDASAALHRLAVKASSTTSLFDTDHPSSTAQDISEENVSILYKISEDSNATSVKHACILFMLEKFDSLSSQPWYFPLVSRILPDIHMFFSTLLVNSHPAGS